MRLSFAFLLLLPPTLVAQQFAALDGPTAQQARSTDSTRVLAVSVDQASPIVRMTSLRPAVLGSKISLGGLATTPTPIELGSDTGDVFLSVPADGPELEVAFLRLNSGERIVARGHAITLGRRRLGGVLQIRAKRIELLPRTSRN